MQAALLRGLENLDKFQPGTSMQAWLFTILRNQFYTDMRKRRREVEDPDGAFAAKIAVMPAQGARLDFTDMQAALANSTPSSVRRCCWSRPKAYPTRKRPRSAAPTSARSRAASTELAPAWRNSWRSMPRRTSAQIDWSRPRCSCIRPEKGGSALAKPEALISYSAMRSSGISPVAAELASAAAAGGASSTVASERS